MKKAIGALSVFLSIMIFSFAIFGWVWAVPDPVYTWTNTNIYYDATVTGDVAIGYDSSDNAHILSIDSDTGFPDTQVGLVYSKSVGTGGSCAGVLDINENAGSAAWDCTVIDGTAVGSGVNTKTIDMEIDGSDIIHASYSDGTDLYYTWCDTSGVNNCGDVNYWNGISGGGKEKVASNANYSDIAVYYFGGVGYPQISFIYDDTSSRNEVVVAEYYGSGGDCDVLEGSGGYSGSDMFQCHGIETGDSVGNYTSIDIGNQPGLKHLLYSITDDTNNNRCSTASSCVVHALHNGGGGACSASGWSCGVVDDSGPATAVSVKKNDLTATGATKRGLAQDSVHLAYSVNNNLYYSFCNGDTNFCHGSYTTPVNIANDVSYVDIYDLATDGIGSLIDKGTYGIAFGTPASSPTTTYIADNSVSSGGNCDDLLSGTDGDSFYCAIIDDGGVTNSGKIQYETGSILALMKTSEALAKLDAPENLDADKGGGSAIPEFGTKLAAVLVGASALGLFGLIVMFRGRKRVGAKRRKK